MFINRLNQLYKPERILYYIDADEEDIRHYYRHGIKNLTGELSGFKDAFGTYDYPGIFFVSSIGKPVIGIEYRIDDSRINYPTNLKSVILKEAFFYSIEIDDEIDVNFQSIEKVFEKIGAADDAHRQFSDLSIKKSPDVISIFSSSAGKKIRILSECKLVKDRANAVIHDKFYRVNRKTLYRMAFFDPITGHYNWNHMVPHLEMSRDKGIKDYAFVHFDVKAFKILNEVYGHTAANKILSRIVKAMNEADFVYTSVRCHNDNFAMIIKDMPLSDMMKKLHKFFDDLSYLEEDPNYTVYYRCGVVPMKWALLLGNRVADAGKMAQALGTSSNKTDIIVYEDEMHDDIMWSNYIKAYLETAIENEEFLVYLQPKFDIQSEKIKGAEALIRWNYKNKELLPPGRFIPFFEKDGSIGKIDDFVLRKVCSTFAKWKKEGRELYPISVNLSRMQLYDKAIIEHLTDIVDSYGVSHELIDFELTESATYDDMEHMKKVLTGLRNKGFRISMDDFGTGYSSLSLLTEIPLDTLKIDKSFVDKVGMESEKSSDLIVISHIISLAKELNFVCLAEGAEQKSQVDKLRSLGCEVIQGYYYSKPVPLEEYEKKYL